MAGACNMHGTDLNNVKNLCWKIRKEDAWKCRRAGGQGKMLLKRVRYDSVQQAHLGWDWFPWEHL